MSLRGENSIQLARYWPGTLLTESGPYLFEVHLPKAECSIKTDEEPISGGGFMLFLKKNPRAIFKMLTGAKWFWLIPSRPEAVLPVLALVSSGDLSCTEGWLKCHILYFDTGYGDSPCVWTFSGGSQVHSPACVRWVAAQVPAWSLPWGNSPGLES